MPWVMSTTTTGEGGSWALRAAGGVRRRVRGLARGAWSAAAAPVKGRWWVVGAVAVVLSAGVASLVLRAAERRATRVGAAMSEGSGERAEVDVGGSLRAMKLVTVELPTRVRSTAEHTSWRGDVRAEVSVPGRMLMGTDLAQAEVVVRRMGAGGPGGAGEVAGYRVTVPPPRAIATELTGAAGGGADERVEVELGWLRFRSRAGEYYLGQARRGLPTAAAGLKLSARDEGYVRRETRQRVAELVRGLGGVGAGADVVVVFADE